MLASCCFYVYGSVFESNNTSCNTVLLELYLSILSYILCSFHILQVSLTGPASIPPVTVNEAFKQTVSKFGHCPALKVKRNDIWITWTYNQYLDDVEKAAKSMIKLGLEAHHGVPILGFNSPEWFITFMASIMV